MKFSSLQENLKSGLFVVGHVAGKNSNLPILNNVMIEARGGKIKLTSTNLEIGVTSVIRGKIEGEGAFTVDAKIIAEYVGLLPNQRVDLEQRDGGLSVVCDNYKTKMNGQAAEDFPLVPVVERDNFYKINAEEFRVALTQVIFAVAPNETRLELSGVLFSFVDGRLVLAATDSYRLAERKLKTENGQAGQGAAKRAIVPAKTVQEVIRILSGAREAEEVEVYLSENQVLFVIGSTEIVSRLIEGQYPDYRQIIPEKAKTAAAVDSTSLSRAVKASALFSKSGVNDINLDFPKSKNTLVISSASGQTGENVAEIEAKVSGEDNGVVINYRYLLDGLNNIGEEIVKLEVVDGNTPCVLKPEKGEDYLYIIMPIKQ